MIKELATKAKKMAEPVLREGATALDKAKHSVLKNKYARYAKMKVNKHPGKFGVGGGYLAAKISEDDNMEE